jgi:hypothetical protein
VLSQSKQGAKKSRWRGDKMTWPQRGELITTLRGHVIACCLYARESTGRVEAKW